MLQVVAQQLGNFGGSGEAVLRKPSVQAGDERSQPGRDRRIEPDARAWGVSSQTQAQDHHRAAAGERLPAGTQRIEHAAEAEQVGAAIERAPPSACSGAMYIGVPATWPVTVSRDSSAT